jgi:hypothetical protein
MRSQITIVGQPEIVVRHGETYAVVTVTSASNPNTTYRVDVMNQRCSCPAWTFSRERKPCKHLLALGFVAPPPPPPVKNTSPYEVLL